MSDLSSQLAQLQTGQVTSSQLVESALKEAQTDRLQAFLLTMPEQARAQAAAIDEARAQGRPLGPLAGLPVAIKDNLATMGLRTTAGSKLLQHFVPPYSATVVEKLEQAGAVIVGKTNLDEFSMGSSSENSAYQRTLNPWNSQRVPGGSSSGSAAAVGERVVLGALGSDTGGSIRQPAAFCGITGLKPTYGRVSRFGLIAYGSSLDQIGPLAISAADCALLLETLAGHDPKDSTSADRPVPNYREELQTNCKGVRIGVLPGLLEQLPSACAASIQDALEVWKSLGAELLEVQLPYLEESLAAYYIVAMAEASSNLSRYDGIRFGRQDLGDLKFESSRQRVVKTRTMGFGAEVRRRILLGTYALSAGYYEAYYHKAQKVRTLIRADFEKAFASVDSVALPVTPGPAYAFDTKKDPLSVYLGDIFTVAANLTGLPAISLPTAPVSDQGELMPYAVQLVGQPWQESHLLSAGHALQSVTDHHQRRAPASSRC